MKERFGICRNKSIFDECFDVCDACEFYQRVTKEEYDNFNEYKTVEKTSFY